MISGTVIGTIYNISWFPRPRGVCASEPRNRGTKGKESDVVYSIWSRCFERADVPVVRQHSFRLSWCRCTQIHILICCYINALRKFARCTSTCGRTVMTNITHKASTSRSQDTSQVIWLGISQDIRVQDNETVCGWIRVLNERLRLLETMR